MSTLKDFGSMAPTFVANVPLKRSPRLLFITINKPDDIKTRNKQSNIRRHVKRDLDRARRARESHKFESTIIGTEDPQRYIPSTPSAEQPLGQPQEQQTKSAHINEATLPIAEQDTAHGWCNNETTSPAFFRPLGAGRGLNPLAPYPIEPNCRTIQLLDYGRQFSEKVQHPLQAIWITIGMSDGTAFNITLASASVILALDASHTAGETTESLNYYTKTVQELGKRLQDPVDSTSDGVFGTILGIACLDSTIGNWERWKLHMSGLQRILRLRGGMKSLQTSSILQVTAFWIDVSGSLILDSIPWLPIPPCANVQSDPYCSVSPRIFAFSHTWNTKFPDLFDISDGIISLASLARDVSDRKTKKLLQKGDLSIALNVYPVAHTLLSMPRYAVATENNSRSSGLIIREILRLTCLLFIGLLKEAYLLPRSGISEYKLRLFRLLTDVDADWSTFMDLRLWVLVVSALAEHGDRSWYVNEIAAAMTLLDLAMWEDALKILKELMWTDEVLKMTADVLGKEVVHFQPAFALSKSVKS